MDELNHLHVLPNEQGGVLVAFNLSEQPAERQLLIDPAELRLSAQQPLPTISNAQAQWRDGRLELRFSIPPRSPVVIEIGSAR